MRDRAASPGRAGGSARPAPAPECRLSGDPCGAEHPHRPSGCWGPRPAPHAAPRRSRAPCLRQESCPVPPGRPRPRPRPLSCRAARRSACPQPPHLRLCPFPEGYNSPRHRPGASGVTLSSEINAAPAANCPCFTCVPFSSFFPFQSHSVHMHVA